MRNHIDLIIFASPLHDSESVIASRKGLFEGIRRFAELEIIYPSMLPGGQPELEGYFDGGHTRPCELPQESDRKTVCFIATGGTEEIFRNYIGVIPRPVLLLSDGLHNSFAASFEIKTFLTRRGIPVALFNAPLSDNPAFYESLEQALFGGQALSATLAPGQELPRFSKAALKAFEKTRIGLIGGASGWLISSGIDRDYIQKTYGSQFTDIPLDELEEDFAATPADDPESDAIRKRMEPFLTAGRSTGDLLDATRLYLALRRICTKYALNALTIKCFGILNTCRTTACLALALLNDEGIVAGCEGDIPALWTMLYVSYTYGEPAFMANPSSSDRRERTIDFAHCTIPLKMVHGYRLPSHFESDSGIGIAGSVPSGRYRILKISGERLDHYYETEGDLIMNTNIPQRCRTQIRFRFASDEEFERFLQVSKGNHIILCRAVAPAGPSR